MAESIDGMDTASPCRDCEVIDDGIDRWLLVKALAAWVITDPDVAVPVLLVDD